MVRVASLNKLVSVKINDTDPSGMTPKEQIDAINEKEHDMVEKRYSTLNRSLLPLLEKNGIFLLKPTDLNEEQQDFIKNYFEDELYPVLTPMADDSSRPFPFISNNSLNLAIMLKNAENTDKLFATLRIPDVFSRIVRLPGEDNDFILLEDIIKEYIGQLFTGFSVEETAVFRVIRDMDLDVAEKDSSDLLRAVQNQLKEREHGGVVRLEIENTIGDVLKKRLIKTLKVAKNAIYLINGPIDLTFLKKNCRVLFQDKMI